MVYNPPRRGKRRRRPAISQGERIRRLRVPRVPRPPPPPSAAAVRYMRMHPRYYRPSTLRNIPVYHYYRVQRRNLRPIPHSLTYYQRKVMYRLLRSRLGAVGAKHWSKGW